MEKQKETTEKQIPEAEYSARSEVENKDVLDKARSDFISKLVEDAEKNKKFFWQNGYLNEKYGKPRSLRAAQENERRAEKAKATGETPHFVRDTYQGINTMILVAQSMVKGYTDSRWGTLKEINKAGGRVKKGERGTTIIWASRKEKIVKRLDENGKAVPVMILDPETNKPKPMTRTVFASATYKVFNICQTEGIEDNKEFSFKTRTITQEMKNLAMEEMVKNSEAPVVHDQAMKNFYVGGAWDTIHVMKPELFKDMADYYGTVAHEIGHSTGHEKRLNRDMSGKFGSDKYAREELVAELTSTFLNMQYGVKSPDPEKRAESHEAYLMNWDQQLNFIRNNPKEFMKVISDADKAARYIAKNMVEKNLTKEQIEEIRGYSEEATKKYKEEQKKQAQEEKKEYLRKKAQTRTRTAGNSKSGRKRVITVVVHKHTGDKGKEKGMER